MKNIPDVKLGVIAVSRDCFVISLSERRRQAVVEAYASRGRQIYECKITVENEKDAMRAIEDVKAAGCNALLVFLGNFGPETPETLIAKYFSGPVLYAAAAEESGDDLINGRGDAYCGMLNCSYNLGLRKLKAVIPEYPVGTPEEICDMLDDFVPVARAIIGLSSLKIITFGPRPQDFFACNAPIKGLYELGVEIQENSELDLLVAYKERFDKDNFIKNLLLDNLLLVDIYSRSKKLHIQTDVPRVVMIVESAGGKDNNVLELARTHFGSNSKDFITAVDESNVIVVKEFAETDTGKEIEKSARALEAALLKEGIREIRIAYGTIVHEIKEVSRSYKEAKMALDVGKIFFDERDIIAYSELGIGRLIYQLPIPLCKMFIREIFGGKSPDDFDEETLTTIYKFFENSLNVSETSRQLFIHRNTLVYRLDKLQKSTGLDLRVFEDAITFKIALMVVKYMKYMETYEY